MRYLSEHQKAWFEDFNEIARFLEIYLPRGLQIHHVGSTSIRGMPAKDIIDVDIECSCGSMAQVVAHLAEAGYEHRGNQGIPTREAFTPVMIPPPLAFGLTICMLAKAGPLSCIDT